jgi:hypothetical protein
VEPRKEPNFSYRLLRAIYPVFRVLFPNQVIPADDLARAMVESAHYLGRVSNKEVFSLDLRVVFIICALSQRHMLH